MKTAISKNKAYCQRGRNSDLIERRNKALIQRFYYWTEVKRRRFDDTLKILSLDEFFISEYTIENIIKRNLFYLEDLIEKKPSIQRLNRI
ncbi:hypothetical protein [Aureibacter tunicatorum]|uniref:Uncharacterized protein n=1 Tax=Aureibacter tunicatorum TaxID=866807 RepID=A0AAE3XTZ2_9BACT|nr:hypothetical protein [Aureibacter tunicatorum]MDR6241950.1 hypothetical protein [Aureibacter tunicatorum]BDD07503.1 hypothetical protein AUTU_49860 [Aureibacter tunicatorum]